MYIKGINGAQGRSRTTDTGIFSPLLYQLSYLGIRCRGLYRIDFSIIVMHTVSTHFISRGYPVGISR